MLFISASCDFDSFTGMVKRCIGGADMAELSIGTLLDSPTNKCCYSTLSGQNISVGVSWLQMAFPNKFMKFTRNSPAFYNSALFKDVSLC